MRDIWAFLRYERRPITHALVARWATFAAAIGFAQLFRSTVELCLGVGFLAGSAALAWSYRGGRLIPAFIGFTVVASACAARAVSAPFIPGATWHGVLIIVSAWGHFAYLAGEQAWSVARKIGER